MSACIGILRIIDTLHLLSLSLGIISDHQLHRIQHHSGPGGDLIQILPDIVLQVLLLDGAVVLGVADGTDEVSDTLRGVASPAHPDEGGHAGIVPAVHETALHQLQELPLTHHRVGEIEPIKLILAGAVVAVLRLEEVDEIVVKGAVGDKLERTDRVGYSLEVVALPMSKVIHRVD